VRRIRRPPGARRRLPLLAILAVALDATIMRLRGYRLGLGVIVRCRSGHVFTTIWLPRGSLKSIRLGWSRFQRCPVGKHWSLVTPVKQSGLTAGRKRSAAEHRDIRIP
jgi:hypothetical protein